MVRDYRKPNKSYNNNDLIRIFEGLPCQIQQHGGRVREGGDEWKSQMIHHLFLINGGQHGEIGGRVLIAR